LKSHEASFKNSQKMPIDIKSVLVCDAVDQSCVELLKSNGILVDYKLKLPKNELIEEAKVSESFDMSSNFEILQHYLC
jgi:D-3-phosphoglycerate dehydrogenase / 2-oxoglutarate reductase